MKPLSIFLLGFLFGVLFWAILCTYLITPMNLKEWEAKVVKMEMGHYDPLNGQFKWGRIFYEIQELPGK